MPKSKFSLGQVVATPGALEAIPNPAYMIGLIARHATGDWGKVDADDKRTNDEAVRDGFRVLSAYPIDPTKPCKGFGPNCVWVITEADRSSTTVLLPSEY
jgi:hypothetical protein